MSNYAQVVINEELPGGLRSGGDGDAQPQEHECSVRQRFKRS